VEVKNVFLIIFSIILSSGSSYASEDQVIKEDKDKVSYSLGYQIGVDFKQQRMDIDTDALLKGVEDALAKMEPRISQDQIQKTLLEMKQRIEASARQEKQAAKEAYRGEDREWLAQNAKKETIVVLPSGLQYRILREGKGRKPEPSDRVSIHQRGTLINGAEFTSSYRKGEPVTVHVSGVIKGLTEGLQLMSEGGKWKFFIPADLGFGERTPMGEKAVIFEVELISIESSQ
jgi:FKBP-type peptidyl-prolyl cis-trans isomerase FklB